MTTIAYQTRSGKTRKEDVEGMRTGTELCLSTFRHPNSRDSYDFLRKNSSEFFFFLPHLMDPPRIRGEGRREDDQISDGVQGHIGAISMFSISPLPSRLRASAFTSTSRSDPIPGDRAE